MQEFLHILRHVVDFLVAEPLQQCHLSILLKNDISISQATLRLEIMQSFELSLCELCLYLSISRDQSHKGVKAFLQVLSDVLSKHVELIHLYEEFAYLLNSRALFPSGDFRLFT